MAKGNPITQGWAARPFEMLESPAYRALSLSAHRALSRIEIELAHHGGKDNGKLPVTFDDFASYGIPRAAIRPALGELEALGFIAITEHGKMARAAEYRRPNKFLLMSRPRQKGLELLDKWKRFETLEEAKAAADGARSRDDKARITGRAKTKAASSETEPIAVQKVNRSGRFASSETEPLRMSETEPLSISRVGTASHTDRIDTPLTSRRCRRAVSLSLERWRSAGSPAARALSDGLTRPPGVTPLTPEDLRASNAPNDGSAPAAIGGLLPPIPVLH
jgi:hypothetical protein